MRHVLSGTVVGAVLLAAVSGALAKPAYVASTVNLRAAPGTTSEIVGKIPSGSLVDAGECSEGWCAITWQDKNGFAIQSALDLSGKVPQRRTVRRPVYGPDEIEEPPIYVEVPPPPYYERPYYYGRPWRHRW